MTRFPTASFNNSEFADVTVGNNPSMEGAVTGASNPIQNPAGRMRRQCGEVRDGGDLPPMPSAAATVIAV